MPRKLALLGAYRFPQHNRSQSFDCSRLLYDSRTCQEALAQLERLAPHKRGGRGGCPRDGRGRSFTLTAVRRSARRRFACFTAIQRWVWPWYGIPESAWQLGVEKESVFGVCPYRSQDIPSILRPYPSLVPDHLQSLGIIHGYRLTVRMAPKTAESTTSIDGGIILYTGLSGIVSDYEPTNHENPVLNQ